MVKCDDVRKEGLVHANDGLSEKRNVKTSMLRKKVNWIDGCFQKRGGWLLVGVRLSEWLLVLVA